MKIWGFGAFDILEIYGCQYVEGGTKAIKGEVLKNAEQSILCEDGRSFLYQATDSQIGLQTVPRYPCACRFTY